eukprot:tig00000989_g6118.t1
MQPGGAGVRSALVAALLVATLLPLASAGMTMNMTAPAATTVIAEACVANPSMASCASFQLPSSAVAADSTSLCSAMDFMVGCSIKKACAKGAGGSAAAAPGGICSGISAVSHTCSNDGTMRMMQGCANWNAMCAAGSAVQQCTEAKAATSMFPTTEQVNERVQGICSEMRMDGCEKCAPVGKWLQCDIQAVYGQLCSAMPNMKQCDLWSATCGKLTGDWTPIGCPAPAGSASISTPAPSMIMYFHAGINEYILFKSWVPKTDGEMVGACVAVFLLAMTYELLNNVRPLAERKVAARRRARALAAACGSGSCPPRTARRPRPPIPRAALPDARGPADDAVGPPVLSGVSVVSEPCPCSPAAQQAAGGASPVVLSSPTPVKGAPAFALPVKRTAGDALADAAMRFVFRLLTAGIGYLCMLVAMTYNGALFCMVIAGYAFGGALFGWLPGYGLEEGPAKGGEVAPAPAEDCCS